MSSAVEGATRKLGGIPYMAPGCQMCKKRKLKCDLQEPSCARCLKRGLTCPGVQKNTILFIESHLPKRKSGATKKNSSLSTNTRQDPRNLTTLALASPHMASPGPEMRMQLFASFISSYFPADVTGSTNVDMFYFFVSNLAALPNKSGMLERALSSIACLYLGNTNHDNHLARHGLHLYNGAIQQMSERLRHDVLDDEVLYATVMFQAIEVIYCSSGLDVWLAHMEGTNSLIRQWARRASSNNLLLKPFYENQKLAMIFSTTVVRRSEEESRRLMLTKEEKPLDGLFNIFMEISLLISRFENVRSADSRSYLELLSICVAHQERTHAWYDRTVDGIGGAPIYYEGDSPCTPLAPSNHLFGVTYKFCSLDNARLHVLYWTALLLIHQLIYRTQTALRVCRSASTSQMSNRVSLPLDKGCADCEFYADQICRAVPYCLQDQMRLWGMHIVVSCLTQAIKIYIYLRREEKSIWCQSAFDLMAQRGSDLATFLAKSSKMAWAISLNTITTPCSSLPLRDRLPRGFAPRRNVEH